MEENYTFKCDRNDCTDLDELISLTKSYYKEGDIINKDYLTWQYLENPSGKPYLFTTREEKTNELAGQYLVIPVYYVIKKEIIKGSLSLNTLTHPKYQGKGLFTLMANTTYACCEEENVFFTTGFPNPQSYPGFIKKLNFKHIGNVPLLIKPLRIGNILFSYLRKKRIKHGGDIVLDPASQGRIKLFDFNDSEVINMYHDFYRNIQNQYDIATYRDFNYIKWRFYELPTRKYYTAYLEEKGRMKGIIIYKAERVWGFNVGLIMDIMILDNDRNVGKELLKFVKKTFKKSRLDFIAILHSHNYEMEILKKSGYHIIPKKILPQQIPFIVRRNKDFQNGRELFDFNNWKLTFGDYDVF